MSQINAVNQIGSQGKILCAYASLLRKLWATNNYNNSVNPKFFKKTLSKDISQFAGYEQQDSQEFLQFLLDTLHEDLNKVLKKPYIEYKDYDGGSLEIYAKQCWEIFLRRENSIMIDLFYGQ